MNGKGGVRGTTGFWCRVEEKFRHRFAVLIIVFAHDIHKESARLSRNGGVVDTPNIMMALHILICCSSSIWHILCVLAKIASFGQPGNGIGTASNVDGLRKVCSASRKAPL